MLRQSFRIGTSKGRAFAACGWSHLSGWTEARTTACTSFVTSPTVVKFAGMTFFSIPMAVSHAGTVLASRWFLAASTISRRQFITSGSKFAPTAMAGGMLRL